MAKLRAKSKKEATEKFKKHFGHEFFVSTVKKESGGWYSARLRIIPSTRMFNGKLYKLATLCKTKGEAIEYIKKEKQYVSESHSLFRRIKVRGEGFGKGHAIYKR